jgi:hypothetical protein
MRNALVILPLLSHLLVSAQSQAQGRDPWTTTLSMTRKAIAVGECSAVSIDLKDASRQGWPRGPNGAYLSMADFDLSVSAPAERAAVGKYDGRAYSICRVSSRRRSESRAAESRLRNARSPSPAAPRAVPRGLGSARSLAHPPARPKITVAVFSNESMLIHRARFRDREGRPLRFPSAPAIRATTPLSQRAGASNKLFINKRLFIY